MIVARIGDDVVSAEAFVKILKLEGKLDSLLEKVLIDKLLSQAADRSDIQVSEGEIQDRVDQFRRVNNLHRAQDTIEYLENVGLSVEELEAFIIQIISREKMRESITNEAAIDQYYKHHSVSFESVELNHITLDSIAKAREITAVLEEDPESFADLARDHSVSQDTGKQGGYLGKVQRGVLPNQIEAKVFNAQPGAILGPFPIEGQNKVEIFQLIATHVPKMNDKTIAQIKQKLFQNWLADEIDSASKVLEIL